MAPEEEVGNGRDAAHGPWGLPGSRQPWPLCPTVCLGTISHQWAATTTPGFGLGTQARGLLPAQTVCC